MLMPPTTRKPQASGVSGVTRSNPSPTKTNLRPRKTNVGSSVIESKDNRKRSIQNSERNLEKKTEKNFQSPQKFKEIVSVSNNNYGVDVNDSPLQFKIVYVSSESQQNPVTNIEQKDREGWCTKPFSEPPHELIFQFQGLARIKQIKVLSHSFKIPTKIEIYIGNLPYSIKEISEKIDIDRNAYELISYQRASFKRIGYTSFQDNSKTDWRAWELKTANVDVTCSYIKFKIRSCHENQLNIYNQVSLIGVEFIGITKEKFPDFVLNTLTFDTGKNSQKGPSLNDMRPSLRKEALEEDDYRDLDRITIEQIKKLIHYKEKARREEDFKKAHFLKSQILGLKQTAHQLIILENQKNEAADNDEFLLAEELKQKILQLKEIKNTYANAALEEEKREKFLIPSQKDEIEDFSIVPRGVQARGIARQVTVEDSFTENRNSFESNRQSIPSGKEFEEEIPFHQPTRRNIDFSNSTDNDLQFNQKKLAFNNEEDFDTANDILQGIKTSIESSPHIIHHEDSPVKYNSQAQEISRETIAHDELPVRPSKNNRYDFETHADAFEPYENRAQPQQFNGSIPDDIVGELDPWEANMVAWIIQHIDSEPTKLLPGVDDLQLFITVFGEFVAKALHSNLRLHREKAIEAIIQNLDQIPVDKQLLVNAVCQYMKRGLKDKIPQVFFLSIELLQKTINFVASDLKRNTIHHTFIPIIPLLISQLGESNNRKKNDSEQTILLISDLKNIGPSIFVKYLLKEDKNDKNWRLIHGKLILLSEFVRRYGFGEASELSDQNIMPIVQKNLNNSKKEVRTAAVSLTLEVFLILRETSKRADIANWFAQKYLQVEMHEALRKEILEYIEKDDPIEAFSNIQPSTSKRRGTITGSQQITENNESTNNTLPTQDINEEEAQAIIVANEDGNLLCNLCDSIIEVHENDHADDLIDQHIMFECPILQKCPLCSAVVEIFDLNHHQLHDCDQKDQIKQCERCKMAVLKEEYDEHIKAKACPQADNETIICPLCGDEIESKNSWKKHLIVDGCPANPKSFKG